MGDREEDQVTVSSKVLGKSSGAKMGKKRKEHLCGLITAWLEVNLDSYVDEEQMWEDMIVIRAHSADSYTIVLLHMHPGWQLFVPAELSDQFEQAALERLHKELNE